MRARRLVTGAVAAALLAVPAVPVAAAPVAAAPAAAVADDDADAVLARTEVTAAMLDDAVLDLAGSAADAVLPLVVEGAVLGLEREAPAPAAVTLTSDLLFDFGSAALTPAASAAVTEIAARLPQGAAVAVDGHTDARGGDAVNVPLSQARAQAVADVLAAGRPDLVLTVTGHGSDVPVADEEAGGHDNPGGRALNRRVELAWTAP